nr:hypothetical protein [Tanacetum cinerariifolium]
MDFLNISTLACAVASKDLHKMMGILRSSTISRITKSTEKINLSIFMSKFSTIPLGVHLVLSAISITILIGLSFLMPKSLYIERVMTLMLAPKSANALLKSNFPMEQWRMKLLGSCSLGGRAISELRKLRNICLSFHDFFEHVGQIVMANPNPEDPNVPNEDVLEEDPHYLLDYDEEEDLEMDIEEEEPEEEPPGNMNGWVDDDDDAEEEDEENENANIEEDDNAKIIFPYEVQGDQTPPPRDESSDSDSEPEAEEAKDEPEAEEAKDKLEVEEGWHDLEALRRHERIREAESETSRTEVALAKKRLSESIWWNKRFYLEMVRKGAVPKPPSDDEGSERPRKTSKKSDGDDGPSDPHGPLMIMPPKPMSEARMREIIRDQFATSMNEFMANMNSGAGGSEGASSSGGAGGSGGTGGNADGTGMDIDGYTNRFHELALLCLRMVEPEAVKVKQYIRGLTKSIRGDVTSSQPATINDAVRLAYQLAGQLIQDKADEAIEGEKRKGKSDRGGCGDNRREHNRR